MIDKIKINKGFTLVEIVSFIGLTALLLLLTYNILILTNRSTTNSSAVVENLENGKIFLDKISSALRQTSEVVTLLPLTNKEINFLPPKEIIFQDPNSQNATKYSKYYLTGSIINKQTLIFYFPNEPNIFVKWNAKDINGKLPLSIVESEEEIAKNASSLQFYGNKLINIDLQLAKNNKQIHLFTAVFSRNDKE